MLTDVRFALRQFLKTPGFSVIALLTLALAIGANVAIFSAIDAVLLHPLPYPDPGRLVIVSENLKHFNLTKIPSSPPEVTDYRHMATTFSQIGAVDGDGSFTLTGDGNAENVPGARVSASVFTILGVKPVAGGLFTAAQEQFGQHRVAVISEGLWKRRYGANPAAIGRNIQINQESYQLIGVIRPILEYRGPADIWTPVSFQPSDLAESKRGSKSIEVIGRLKPGVSLEQSRAEFRTIAARMAQQHPDDYKSTFGYSLDVDPLAERAGGDLKTPLLVLIAAVGMVMLIACANVSNLLLARAMVRRREISVRAALGASRGRIVRQLLTESFLLAAGAGVAGLAVALGGLALYAQFGPPGLIRGTQPEINGWVLAFSILLSMAASVVFGLAPALAISRTDLNDALKEGSRGSSGGRRLLRETMVALEVAVSLVLLIGAGLLVRSFVRLVHADPGFRADHVLTAQIILPVVQYKQPSQLWTFQKSLLDRVHALPGVRKADAINFMPFSNTYSASDFTIEGHPFNPNDPSPVVIESRTGPDYFEAMGIPLIRGRVFQPGDDQGAQKVAVIDETTARRFFSNLDPIGLQISSPVPKVNCTVVGIVGALKYRELANPPEPIIYYSAAQMPPVMINLAIRTAGDPLALAAALRHEVAALDPDLPVSRTATLESRVANSLQRQRFSIELMAGFAAVAALLAAIGIYGVLSYLVDQRRRELGIRMALGARAGDVLGLIVRQGSAPIGIGLAVGVAGAFGLTWLLKSLLYEVSATDPIVYVCVSIGLMAVALVAMLVPARRATRIDPLHALRHE
jgi:putative ABC transport system permease protein